MSFPAVAADRALVPAVIGHRGAAGHAPENTLASIARAAELGARWVEFDTMLTRDGEVVLFHDDTLDRTTDGSGPVADRNLAELRALDAGGWFGPAFRGERIPTLQEALAELARLGLGVNVEIKPTPGRDRETGRVVAALLSAAWPAALPPPLLSSYRPTALAAAAEVAPELPRALIVRKIEKGWRGVLRDLGCTALHCGHRHFTRRRAETVLGAGFALRCFTVNERARAETVMDWGADGVFTDYPDRMAGLRRREVSHSSSERR